MCRGSSASKKTVRSIASSTTPRSTSQDTSSDESIYHIRSPGNELPVVTVEVNGISLELLVDTGAGVNAVGKQTWHKHLRMQLEETKTKLVPYGIKKDPRERDVYRDVPHPRTKR